MVTSPQSAAEDQDGQGQGDGHHPLLAKRTLVPYYPPDVDQQAPTGPSEYGLASTGQQPPHSRQKPNVVTRSLERRRQKTVTSGASPAVVKILYESTRVKKRAKGNSTAQLAFERWTHYFGVDPLEATAVHVMNYLAYGLETKGWKRSTAINYKSAILQLFSDEERTAITSDYDFQQFVKLAGTDSFKRLRNYDIDMEPLFKRLHDLGSNDTMSMTDLTAKTCFLLSICGLLRADDLQCVDVTQSEVKDDTLTLTVLFPKELRGGLNIIKPVVIRSHPKEECCPVKAEL
jgi:hypothetical protein